MGVCLENSELLYLLFMEQQQRKLQQFILAAVPAKIPQQKDKDCV